jgi:hypothetical protein
METHRHDHGAEDDAVEGGEHAGEGYPQAQSDDRKNRETVFLKDKEEVDDQKGKKARHFPQRLHQAHLLAVNVRHLHRKIIDQGAPALEPCGRQHGQQHQEEIHPAGIIESGFGFVFCKNHSLNLELQILDKHMSNARTIL